MASVALQRLNMVESQVRPSDITDRRIIRAMQAIAREDFVPPSQTAIVYGDLDVPLSAGRTLMTARVFAKLLQLAEIGDDETVLIVGAGMGYSAAVVSSFAKHVVALECDKALSDHGRQAVAKLKITNVNWEHGPLTNGHANGAPYHAIVVEGAIATEPTELLAQLAPGGRLVAVVIDPARDPATAGVTPRGSGKAVAWHRHGRGVDRGVSSIEAFDASATILPGFQPAPVFTF